MKTKFYLRLGMLALLGSLSFHVWAQDVQVRGVITDENNEPIPGASVLLKGTTVGMASDIDGVYSISAPSNGTLLFSFIGYETQEISIGNRSVIDVALKLDLSDLEEVVVVGYGTVKKSQLTGAIASVSSREINELPITDARQALQGRASGVDVTQAGSKPGAAPQVRIRGRRSFNAGNDPLYVVDNIPIVGGLTDFNSQDIASMEVLKDASATAIYGSRGANGVVLITTKRGETGKTKISWDSYYGISTGLGRIENFNGPEFADYKRESRRASGEYPEGPNNQEADEAIFEPNELESIRLGRRLY
jgi:TonB-linked SusC/RagA family outer membrane protein